MSTSTERERDLQLRLAEAQSTINALLSGEIDAVVDAGTQTPVLLAKAQEALRASEERYRRIIETTSEGVWVIDARSVTTFMNPRMTAILGCRSDGGIGCTPFDCVESGERQKLADHLARTNSGQSEIRFTRADGTRIRALLDSAPLFNSAGDYDGSLTMVMDITERRNAEESLERVADEQEESDRLASELLRRERDRAQHYLNTAGVILLALDLQGRITLVNRYACDMLGWSADELLGRDWFTTCVPEHLRPALRDKFGQVLTGDLPTFVNAIVTKSGDERLVEWHNTLEHDTAGAVTGTFSSGTDITVQHNALSALRETEERMQFALKRTNVGIWEMDYKSGVTRWSEILEAQHGLTPRTFDGTFEGFVALIHPEDRKEVLAIIGQAVKAGGDFRTQYRSTAPDGTERWLASVGHIVLDAEGKASRATGITQDITERRALETHTLQSQRMEAVGRLAGGVAHDFNNILSVIMTCGEFLLQDLKPLDPARVDAEEIVKAARRAAALTQQLLMFSRQQVLAPKLLNLGTVVTEMESMLRRVVGEDIDLKVTKSESLGRVRADAGSIEQVLMNLAVNARDAMPTGGTLAIDTRNTFVDEALAQQLIGGKPGPHIALSVRDTGAGIDATTLARIFEPFYSTKAIGQGTGLGLSTVFGIVQQSRGAVRVESVVGTGTTFTIYLPRDEASADAAQIHTPISLARGTETILLVEDEAPVRSVARAVLQRNGYRIIEMRSPADALLYCEGTHEHIDLVLTDVVMPLMNGPELVRRVVEILPNVKVLYMSGYTDDDMVRHGVLQGEMQFLQKPFTTDSLNRKVREVLSAAPAE